MKREKLEPLFSEETMESLIELGEVLRRIRNRLISEGYVIKDGQITPPGSQN